MATQNIPYKTMYGEKKFMAAPTGTRYDQKYRSNIPRLDTSS